MWFVFNIDEWHNPSSTESLQTLQSSANGAQSKDPHTPHTPPPQPPTVAPAVLLLHEKQPWQWWAANTAVSRPIVAGLMLDFFFFCPITLTQASPVSICVAPAGAAAAAALTCAGIRMANTGSTIWKENTRGACWWWRPDGHWPLPSCTVRFSPVNRGAKVLLQLVKGWCFSIGVIIIFIITTTVFKHNKGLWEC